MTSPCPKCGYSFGRPSKLDKKALNKIRKLKELGLTIREISRVLKRKEGIVVHHNTIHYALKKQKVKRQ